jgi:hypothetical protein
MKNSIRCRILDWRSQDFGLAIAGFWIGDFGFWIERRSRDFGLAILDFGLKDDYTSPKSKIQNLKSKIQTTISNAYKC